MTKVTVELTMFANTGRTILHAAILLTTSVVKETKVHMINIIIQTGTSRNTDSCAPNHIDSQYSLKKELSTRK